MVRVATYYFAKCPLHDGCTATSWTRIKKCGAYTLEEAKAKLVNHLTNSKLHYIDKEEAYEIADTAAWEVHETDDEEIEPTYRVGQGAAKRLRPISPRRPSTSTICELAIRETIRNLSNNMSSGSGDTGTSIATRGDLQDAKEAAREATKRALAASRHAQRLSLSAAAAYETEIKRLELALEDLKELV